MYDIHHKKFSIFIKKQFKNLLNPYKHKLATQIDKHILKYTLTKDNPLLRTSSLFFTVLQSE